VLEQKILERAWTVETLLKITLDFRPSTSINLQNSHLVNHLLELSGQHGFTTDFEI